MENIKVKSVIVKLGDMHELVEIVKGNPSTTELLEDLIRRYLETDSFIQEGVCEHFITLIPVISNTHTVSQKYTRVSVSYECGKGCLTKQEKEDQFHALSNNMTFLLLRAFRGIV